MIPATTRLATPTITSTCTPWMVNSDAVAYATLRYAMNTEDINAVKGKGNFQPVPGNSDEHRQDDF